MPPELIDKVVQQVVARYLGSNDFNGHLWSALEPKLSTEDREMRAALKALVQTGRITFRTSSLDLNPGIKRAPDLPTDREMQLADEADLDHLTLFPTLREMSSRTCPIDSKARPFTAMLAQGHAQLDFRCFSLDALEYYRNDPRYFCKASDVEGHIYRSEEQSSLKESDQIFLQTFGFAYDYNFTRAVAVYIRYLSGLTDEHQRLWEGKLLQQGTFQLHPDYRQMTLVGAFPTHLPILDAFTLELQHINRMSSLMQKAPLFRHAFRGEEKPTKFTLLIRPTSHEFNDFALLLDKMMSDNINKEFFKGDIALEEDIQRSDGKIEVRQIGTIRLLETWIKEHVTMTDTKPMAEAIQAFREVRELRQNPAHVIKPDRFDQVFFQRQRELIIRAYTAVRFLRLLFANHPSVHGYAVEPALAEGRIRGY